MDTKVGILNFGVELGYQFIFWKRFSVDLLLFGPSYSMISTSVTISGDLDQDQVDDLNQELVDKLLDRFPALETVFSDEGHEFESQKSRFSPLLRYSIQFGFHF
jgi:hypothetical protein